MLFMIAMIIIVMMLTATIKKAHSARKSEYKYTVMHMT